MSAPAGRFLELGTVRSSEGTLHALRAYVPAVGGPGPRPLMVMFDGQNVFEDQGSYAGGWYAHEAVERLTASTLRAPVVLGIANGGKHRVRELGGHLAPFLDSVILEALARARRCAELTERRVVAGSSLGGLAALQLWLTRSDLFDGAIAMSPSLWFGHQRLLRDLAAGHLRPPPGGRVYVDAGRRERGRLFADAELLVGLLGRAGLGADRLMWRPDSRGAHHERHWRRRLPKALRFLFRSRGA